MKCSSVCYDFFFLKAEQTECIIEVHQIFMVAHGQKNPSFPGVFGNFDNASMI